MRIAVIAAGGRSGQAFVWEALAAGHEVRAGIHKDDPFEAHPDLTVLRCDATDKAQVTKLIDRCDAVVSLIGHVKGSPDFVQRDAMRAIVAAMEVAGVKRVVSLTGVGVGGRSEAISKFIADISVLFGVKRLRDGMAHAKVLEASRLDWTVLKVLFLTDGEPGKFVVKPRGLVKAPTPRREVARAILRVLADKSFAKGYAIISR